MKRIIGLETELGTIWGSGRFHGVFLPNGGRIYVDSDHVEICTPECTNPRDVVMFDKALEAIAKQKAPMNKYYKNNTDSRGAFFGCHENYLTDRDLDLDKLVAFLATRIIFSGSGDVRHGKYLLSQKAQSVKRTKGGSTTSERGLIHGYKDKIGIDQGRLHLVFGDSNMSEVANYLKLGTTSLVLRLLEDRVNFNAPILSRPVADLQLINENPVEELRLEGGKYLSAIDIQRIYLKACERYIGDDPQNYDIITRWEQTLDALEHDHMSLDRQVDWVIKKRLLRNFMEKHGITDLNDPRVLNINLQYHDLDKNKGLFYFLQKNDLVDRIVSDEEIKYAIYNPPEDTRAWARGHLIKRDILDPRYTDWNSGQTPRERTIHFKNPCKTYENILREFNVIVTPRRPRPVQTKPVQTSSESSQREQSQGWDGTTNYDPLSGTEKWAIRTWLEQEFFNGHSPQESANLIEQRMDEVVYNVVRSFRWLPNASQSKRDYYNRDLLEIRFAYSERNPNNLREGLIGLMSSIEWD